MKNLIIVLGFIALVYLLTILTSSSKYVYNATDNQVMLSPNNIPAFSYEDGTEIGNSLRN